MTADIGSADGEGAPRFVAVIDIGKTNAKLALHDLDGGTDAFVATTANTVVAEGPYPHMDTDHLWRFLLASLRDCAASHPVEAISITTHGACAVLVDDEDLVLPMLDYESPAPEALRAAYDRVRPPFDETYSPRLPNGLNVGAQLFWLEATFPDAFARARHILFHPQYWAFRLTGVAAGEVTSIGCHTDLWMPAEGRVSRLVAERGWTHLLPPMRSAFDRLGDLKPELAAAIGLAGRRIPVHCGLHDSNASLLSHLLRLEQPFAVLSTGTWIVALAVGGRLDGLDPGRDTLANVDAFGRPVPSARFMGGREFDLLTGGRAAEPTPAEIEAVLAEGTMVLPTFAPGTGPFPEGQGRWTRDPDALSPGTRTAAASLYAALMTARMLELIGAGGPTIVEGPFARNRLYLNALARLTGRAVAPSAGATGTTSGAACLAVAPDRARRVGPPATPDRSPDQTADAAPGRTGASSSLAALHPVPPPDASFDAYAAAWRASAEG
ncbi:FGGY-family carbohydrate kinase [Aureimonas sp. Leaf454]|uniref:FGGY-family carbohydrate kinase n=1 Tax=Aureimonas sp. Leaf454 TaxID=1736381 RepID=UPI0009E6F447|nr:FGGY-family carbohydrate kinase [Aureimonas sp. Leaf454]